MAFDSTIIGMRVVKVNLNYEFENDIANGKGILINQIDAYDKKGQKNFHGLQSQFFGSDFSDEIQYRERWSCKCKKYIGKGYAGKICEECHTPVEFTTVDLEKFGYIQIKYFKILSPLALIKLQDILGKSNGEYVLDKILNVSYNVAGEKTVSEREEKENKKHPYFHKGMRYFTENFQEIMMYYMRTKPAKAVAIQELMDSPQTTFTNYIPVPSSTLRPESPGIKEKKFYSLRINQILKSLIRTANNINELGKPSEMSYYNLITVDRYLGSLHRDLSAYKDELYNTCQGKRGVFQGKVIHGRYNFSSRNVITPGIDRVLRINEIEMPYISFLELYRYELLNLYCKKKNCNIHEASNAWTKACVKFDPIFYRLMTKMINEHPDLCWCLINRNPSINVGSFDCMRVAGVKEDIYDKTLTIPNGILKPMNADFDGDQLNVFRIFGKDFIKRFRELMDPARNLTISRLNGTVNADTLPTKDEIACMWFMLSGA